MFLKCGRGVLVVKLNQTWKRHVILKILIRVEAFQRIFFKNGNSYPPNSPINFVKISVHFLCHFQLPAAQQTNRSFIFSRCKQASWLRENCASKLDEPEVVSRPFRHNCFWVFRRQLLIKRFWSTSQR